MLAICPLKRLEHSEYSKIKYGDNGKIGHFYSLGVGWQRHVWGRK